MSHATGEVYRDGRIVGYFEYDGTVDIACTALRATPEGVHDHWRADNDADCGCGGPGTEVTLYADYGSGFHWPGRACLACGAITAGLDPDGAGAGWPRDGRPAGAVDPDLRPGR